MKELNWHNEFAHNQNMRFPGIQSKSGWYTSTSYKSSAFFKKLSTISQDFSIKRTKSFIVNTLGSVVSNHCQSASYASFQGLQETVTITITITNSKLQLLRLQLALVVAAFAFGILISTERKNLWKLIFHYIRLRSYLK